MKSFKYTSFGDMQEVDECADGGTFATTYQYDGLGRQSLIRYPVVNTSQLAVGYHYTSAGYLQYLSDDSSDYSILWQAKAMNALGQVTDEQMRNGVETVSNRNPLTGWLLGSTATAHADQDNVIQNWSYGFDEIGNLLTRDRNDAINAGPSSETFTYDLTNRLATSRGTTSGASPHQESYTYDALGNLTQKAGSRYTYGTGCRQAGSRAAGPHAVCTVAGGAAFEYDDNGNLTSSGSRSVTYNPSNKVTHVESDPATSQGNDTGSVDFMYGADGNRVVQVATSGGVTSRTVYVGLGATGKSLYERTTTPGASTTHVHYIYAGDTHGGGAFALRVLDDSGAVTSNRYYSVDHLGSVTAMSDDKGHVSGTGSDATAFGYDAWGARRNPDGTAANPASFDLPVGHREVTGQEQIPNVGLVNMNGRLYDPTLARFLSPDPNVQFVADLQSYNRYSYAGNNPLRYTDPTGYFWGEIGGFFGHTFGNPIVDAEIGLTAIACAATYGAGCVAAGLIFAAANVGVAVDSGASFGQSVLIAGIGLGIGVATGEVGQELGMSVGEALVLGSVSAAVTAGISNVISGRDFFETNLLSAAVMTAVSGAATQGLRKVAEVSRASATAAQGGGGSGEARLEAMNRFLRQGGYQLHDPTADEGSAPMAQDMTFDGSRLRMFEPETYSDPYMTPDRRMVADFPGVSGREGYQSAANQELGSKGPLPEGDYLARQSALQDRLATSGWNRFKGVFGGGTFPGGERSWGDYRVWLDPLPGTDTFGRSGFSIHGGAVPGSAGCIDLTGSVNSFVSQFRLMNQDLTLRVQY